MIATRKSNRHEEKCLPRGKVFGRRKFAHNVLGTATSYLRLAEPAWLRDFLERDWVRSTSDAQRRELWGSGDQNNSLFWVNCLETLSYPFFSRGSAHTIFSCHQKVFQGTGNERLNIWKFPVGQTSLLFILEAKALFPNDFEIFWQCLSFEYGCDKIICKD